MWAVTTVVKWIIDLSEGERFLAKRFSLSPSAEDLAETADPAQSSAGAKEGTKATGGTTQPMSILERRAKESSAGTNSSVPQPDSAQQNHAHTLPFGLQKQIRYLQRIVHYPRNGDIVFSRHETGAGQVCMTVYSSVTVQLKDFEEHLLSHLPSIREFVETPEAFTFYIPTATYTVEDRLAELASAVVEGKVVVLLGGSKALLYTFTSFPTRAVSTPINETVLRGSQEAFTEDLQTNMGQMRRYVRCANLVMESVTLQDPARTQLVVCSMAGETNQKLLAEVHRRINAIGPIPLNASGLIEQHLEDHWRSLFPTMLYTERPDLASRYLTEGHVLVLIANVPLLLIAPSTFWMQFTTAEDRNLRYWYTNFLRIIRGMALFNALLLPAMYISLTNFQQEMIPSDILLAMTSARQNLPFPTIVEVLLLESAFELIREASVRVPHVIGSTIGIVGALILGQSAVEANLVSPLVVIIVAMTGLGSFAIPNQSIGYAFRILRYIFTVSSFLFGFFGIAVVFSLLLIYLSSMQSYGVPYMTPIAPFRSKEEGFFRKSVLAYSAKPVSIRSSTTTDAAVQKADNFLDYEDTGGQSGPTKAEDKQP